jgi:hypothetical protein
MNHSQSETRCKFTDARSHRCRLPRADGHTLCGTHLRAQQRRMRVEPSTPVHDLLDGITDLRSPAAVNHVLANLTIYLADGRIDPRTTVVLAYLCQLLLQTIAMARNDRHEGGEPAADPLLQHLLPSPVAAISAIAQPEPDPLATP